MDDMIKDISAEIDYILDVRWDYDSVKYIGKWFKKLISHSTKF